MTDTESPKSNFKIILISALIIGLLAVSLSAYVFRDRIFVQGGDVIIDQNNQTQLMKLQKQSLSHKIAWPYHFL